MNILITGASGFIGQALIPHLLAAGHHLWAWTQSPSRCRELYGDSVHVLTNLVDYWQLYQKPDIDAIINLAGAGIADRRWTNARKHELLNSRIECTDQLIAFIAELERKPLVLLSASAIGYYGSHDSAEALDEQGDVAGGFTHELCRQWEERALAAEQYGVRVCLLRTGIVLGHGGALAKMRLPFYLGLGGQVGSGQQWMSWIHIADEVAAISFLLHQGNAAGAFNLTAPEAVQNNVFTKSYAQSLRRPALLPLPAFVPKLMLGEGAELLLQGQRVYPARLLELGFEFSYPTLQQAFADLAD